MKTMGSAIQQLNTFKMLQLPEVVGAVVPKPPKLEPPNPDGADVVAVLNPPNAGADVAGVPKPTNQNI